MSALRHIFRTLSRYPCSFITSNQIKDSHLYLVSRTISDKSWSSNNSITQNLNLPCSRLLSLKKSIHTNNICYEREHLIKSESASYEGSGKTTVTILNEDVQFIMIDSIGLYGFKLNTGLKGNIIF